MISLITNMIWHFAANSCMFEGEKLSTDRSRLVFSIIESFWIKVTLVYRRSISTEFVSTVPCCVDDTVAFHSGPLLSNFETSSPWYRKPLSVSASPSVIFSNSKPCRPSVRHCKSFAFLEKSILHLTSLCEILTFTRWKRSQIRIWYKWRFSTLFPTTKQRLGRWVFG